jgi:hypothetical protein
MMIRVISVIAGLALLAGCGENPPAEKVRDDARDIAMVKRMNQAPFKPILPEPITAEDMARYDLGRDGCSFRRGDDAAADLLFITQEDRGYLKVGGKLQTVAAKQGSAELPAGARSTYVGLDNWVELVAQAGSGGVDAPDLSEWPSRMVIHDAQERVGFDARGMVRCKG